MSNILLSLDAKNISTFFEFYERMKRRIFINYMSHNDGFLSYWKKYAFYFNKRISSPYFCHNTVTDPLKIVPTQFHAKFNFRDDQSTHLTILIRNLATFCPK